MAQSRMTFTWAGGKAEFGKQLTINITRDSQSYRHVLVFSFNGTVIDTHYDVTNMDVYTPSLSLMSQIPFNNQGTFTVECRTYEGSTAGAFIGRQTKTVDIFVPSNVVPTIAGVSLSDPTGYLDKYGAYVLGKSKIRAEINASSQYGASVSIYKLSIGTTYDVSDSQPVVTIDDVNITGTIKVTATATDTRQRSAQTTQQVQVVPYSVPDLSPSSADRWNQSSGREDDESTTVRIRARGSVYDVNSKGANSATVKVETSPYDSETWTTRDTRTVGAGSFDYSIYVSGFDTNQRFKARITITDDLESTSQTIITIETAQPVLDFRANGKGLAVFGVSTKDGLQVYGDVEGTGDISADGSLSAGGSASVAGQLSVATGVMNVRDYYGHDTGERMVCVAKSQKKYNDNTNLGFLRITGVAGGYTASSSGIIDLTIPFRDIDGMEDVDFRAYSKRISSLTFCIVLSKDASGYVYVYLRLSGYWAFNLQFSGRQCDFRWDVATGSAGTYPGMTGTKFADTAVNFNNSSPYLEQYPVGSVVIRYDHTSPASYLGGTWARIEGRFLYATGASGTIGATGGSGTHTLTTAQIPSHTHGIYMKKSSTEGSQYGLSIASAFAGRVYITGDSTNTYATGSGQAHNNNPAFINVSVWRRIA